MFAHVMPSWPTLAAFVAASLVLAITPGPGVLYIVTRSLVQGRIAGLTSVASIALGNLGNAIGAALGLAALFAISSLAFTIVKYTGAAYLIFLGLRTLLTRRAVLSNKVSNTTPLRVIFRDGFFVALLNPKTAVFFGAFLPQFLAPDAAVGQSMFLATIFVLIAAITDSIYAVTAGAFSSALAGSSKAEQVGRQVSGTVFIALGLLASTTELSRPR